MPKPLTTLGIGVDTLPQEIRLSRVLTGNDLGMLGNIESFPNSEEINTFINASDELKWLRDQGNILEIHKKAQDFLCEGKVEEAWKILLATQ